MGERGGPHFPHAPASVIPALPNGGTTIGASVIRLHSEGGSATVPKCVLLWQRLMGQLTSIVVSAKIRVNTSIYAL